RPLLMARDGLEAVPELVFEADARLAARDHDGSLGNGRIHECPFLQVNPRVSPRISGLTAGSAPGAFRAYPQQGLVRELLSYQIYSRRFALHAHYWILQD